MSSPLLALWLNRTGAFMKLKTLSLTAIGCIALVMLILAAILYGILAVQRATTRSEEDRLTSWKLADSLRQSSDDLTNLARSYVSTGLPQCETDYITALQIRNGVVPRPAGYSNTWWWQQQRKVDGGVAISLQDLMRRAGFRENEFELLRESERRSNHLVQLENEAFAAMKGRFPDDNGGLNRIGPANPDHARQLLYGAKYHAEKARIMQPIQAFLQAVELRTSQELRQLEQQQTQLAQLALVTVLLALTAILLLGKLIRQHVLNPIDDLIAHVRQGSNGNYSAHIRPHGHNELATLAIGFNRMTDSVENDMAARLESEQLMREAKRAAEAANHSKSEFLANMSHEIRTPMHAILGMLQLLQHTGLSARQLDYSTKAQSAARALLGIINDILDFSKIEAGKMELDCHPFVLADVLRDLGVMLAVCCGTRPVEVLFDVDPHLPQHLVGDAMRLRQVLLNLASNAIKFTEKGEVVIAVKCREQSAAAVTITFAVRDTGIGIAPDKLEFIFSGFSQAESSTTRRFGGTGLGLAISQRLVNLMGGQLAVESEVGRGSVFHFALHLEIDLSERVPLPKTALPGDLRILIVDDNPLARQILQDMARELGWHCEAMASGVQALARLGRGDIGEWHAILLDWQMPEMDGCECARHMRELPGLTAAMVMVTAHGRELLGHQSDRERALFDGYLLKPITHSTLHDAVQEAVNLRHGLPLPHAAMAASMVLQGLRLLVVEDNLMNQQIAQELLRKHGARVEIANGGLDGVAMTLDAAIPFDGILMDLQMPDIDGFEATRRILAQRADAVIIAMTANAQTSDRLACLEAGMKAHVSKPVELAQLLDTIVRHCRKPAPGAPLPPSLPPQAEAVLDASPPLVAPPLVAPPLVDMHTAIARLGGDQTFYQRLLRTFQLSGPALFGQLAEALGLRQFDKVQRDLHTLRGLAASVGASQLAHTLGQAEDRLRQLPDEPNQPPMPQDLAQNLAQDLTRIEQHLHKALHLLKPGPDTDTDLPHDAPAARTQNQADLLQTLDKLAAHLQAGNMQALEVSAALHLQHAPHAALAALDQAVQALDFTLALSECATLKMTLRQTNAAT
jgi:signal transduction histidine kinase/DNA-binding response OmpR family regulator/HPt (histidine-containing phosphotransfer) domain-containing protein